MDSQKASKTLLHIPEDMYDFLHAKSSLEYSRCDISEYGHRFLTDRIFFFGKELTIFFDEDTTSIYRRETDFATFRIFVTISLDHYNESSRHTSGLWTHPLYEIKSVGSFKAYGTEEMIEEKKFGITCSRRNEINPRDIQFEICTYLDSIVTGMLLSQAYEDTITVLNKVSP
jgi:hypothetical protein